MLLRRFFFFFFFHSEILHKYIPELIHKAIPTVKDKTVLAKMFYPNSIRQWYA